MLLQGYFLDSLVLERIGCCWEVGSAGLYQVQIKKRSIVAANGAVLAVTLASTSFVRCSFEMCMTFSLHYNPTSTTALCTMTHGLAQRNQNKLPPIP